MAPIGEKMKQMGHNIKVCGAEVDMLFDDCIGFARRDSAHRFETNS